jgi:hypothetical protein
MAPLRLLQPLFRLQPQRRLLALGLVGVAMCAVPLVQVLRYQGQEIALAQAALAGLDPVAGTVALQRGLVEHRDLAGQVLRGQVEAENPRRQRQAEVDARLAVLGNTLQQRAARRAEEEAAALSHDWRTLVQRIVDRALAAPESDAAHRLLVEQSIQIIDLVADALPLRQERDASVAPVVDGLAQGLPRLTVALMRLPTPTGPVTAAERKAWEPGIKATEALLEKVLQPLGESRPVGVLKDNRELPDAVARSLAAGHGHLRLLLSPRATPEGLQASQRQALLAHFAVLNAAHATLGHLAEARVSALQAERTRGLLAIGALALVAAALLLTLWSGHTAARGVGARDDERPRTDGHWPVRRNARQLIDRLRGVSANAAERAEPPQGASRKDPARARGHDQP